MTIGTMNDRRGQEELCVESTESAPAPGLSIETGAPMGSLPEQAHVELGSPPHRLRRQPRLNRLRPRSSRPRASRAMAICVFWACWWSLAWWVPESLLWASSTSVFSVSQRLNRLPSKSLARWAAWRNFISSRSLPVSSSFHFCGIGCFFAGLQWREDAATRAVQRLRLVLTAGYARCRPISRRRTGQGTR